MCTRFEDEPFSPRCADLPISVISHRIACDQSGEGLFLVGGWKSGAFVRDNFVRDVWKFNFSSKFWTRMKSEDPPPTLANHSLTRLGQDRLLVYGGSLLGRDQLGNNDETFLYDTRAEKWTKLVTTGDSCPKPSKHWFGQAARLCGSRLYVATGRREGEGPAKLLAHRLDLETLRWSYLSKPETEPPGRVRHEMIVYDNKIFVFGGAQCSFDSTYPLDTILGFDPISSTWYEVKTKPDPNFGFPESRTCHTMVEFEGYVYLCGGYFIPPSGDRPPRPKAFDDLWKFHPPTLKWTKLGATLPFGLWSHAADVTEDGRMYVFGGCARTERTERTNRLLKIWLGAPKLERMVWEQVVPHLLADEDAFGGLDLPESFSRKLAW